LIAGNAQKKHIRDLEKGRFVSFSIQKEVACYYATKGYKKSGYIAIARFPDILESFTIVLQGPYMYRCTNNTVWIDLRALSSLDEESIAAHSRTLVDHELLLMQGTIQAQILSVRPRDCNRTFSPWARWGENV
jgi:hypothetical protein